eukprot:14504348-Alexandrium_andersonii.AAC.1
MHEVRCRFTMLISDLDAPAIAEGLSMGSWHSVKTKGPGGALLLRKMLAVPLCEELAPPPMH